MHGGQGRSHRAKAKTGGEGDECKGTYPTRAEARRAQQQLAESAPESNCIIRDGLDDVVSYVRAEEGGDPAKCHADLRGPET